MRKIILAQMLVFSAYANASNIDEVMYRRCSTQLNGELKIGKKIILKKIGCGESVKEFTSSSNGNSCRYHGKVQNHEGFSCQIWGNQKFSKNSPETIEVAEDTLFGFKSEKGSLGFSLFNRLKEGQSFELVCKNQKVAHNGGGSLCELLGDLKIGDLKSGFKSLNIEIKAISEKINSQKVNAATTAR